MERTNEVLDNLDEHIKISHAKPYFKNVGMYYHRHPYKYMSTDM